VPAAQALPAAVVAPPAAGAPATLTTSVRPGIEAPPPSHQATTDSGTAGGASSGAGGQFADILFDGDQSPGVQISGTATLTEGGASGSYQVVLKTAPTDTVTVTLSADPALSLSASTFTFTPSNWSTPQSFTAVAVTDSDAEGFHAADIQSGTSSSSDPDYNSINGDTFVVNILDANGPNAVDDTVQTTQGVALPSINVLANDVDPNSYTLTVTGITQGDEGGAVSLNPDQTVSYTPATGYTGLDHFTYTIDNGHGQTTVGYVDVYVAPVEQAPVLAPVANQTNSEDDNVSLTVSGSDPDGDQVFYTASNLPLGLSINYLTGQISGQLAENAANPVLGQPVSNSHTYAVTVTGTDAAGLTSSQTFNWTINHTNHAPWLEFPGAFVGAPMTPANIQIVGHDPDAVPGRMIDQLTYSLTGTPASLTINPTTGLITGMFTAAAVGTYSPQVTVSDGQLTATQSFALTVLSSPSPIPPATRL